MRGRLAEAIGRCSDGEYRSGRGGAGGVEFPDEVGGDGEEEDYEGVFVLGGGAEGEVYADVSEAGGDGFAVGLHVRSGGEDCEDRKADDGPEYAQALASGDEEHAPPDEDRGAEVEGAVELEVDILRVEELEWAVAEGGDGLGKKDLPAETEETEGEEPDGGEKSEWGEGEDGPGCAGREGSGFGLGESGVGERVGGAEAGEGGGAGGGGREAAGLLFGGEVG